MYYLYRHIRLDKNEPFYIGIGKTKNYKRAHNKIRRNKFWKNIISKTDYEVEILLDNLTEEQAKEKEVEFIKLYGRRDLGLGPLVNLTDGGDGTVNIVVSEEKRKTISERNKGYKHTEEAILKISEASKNMSKESRELIASQLRGKERILSEESLEKMRLGAINSHKNRTKHHSSKKVINIKTGYIYDNIVSCAKELNEKSSNLRRYLRGERKNKYPYLKIMD